MDTAAVERPVQQEESATPLLELRNINKQYGRDRALAWTAHPRVGLAPVAGHPESYLAAFANVYCDIADVVLARRTGVEADPLAYLFPTVEDGTLGVMFVEAAVASHRQDGRWVAMKSTACQLRFEV